MSLGTNLNTPAPDVNQAAPQAPERNDGGQQQVGGGEPSFGMTTAAARLREWSAARTAGASRPVRFVMPSPGHAHNPLFEMTPGAEFVDPYYGYGPARRPPAPMHAPMPAPMHAPMHAHTPRHAHAPPPSPQGGFPHTPYAQQTPYGPQLHQGQWGMPTAAGPTYKKRYEAPPGFSGAPPGTSQRGGSTVRGYERDVRDWLELFGDALADHDLSPRKVVMLLAMQLGGSAKTWYQELKNREPNNPAFQSVEDWLAAIRERYTDPNIELEAMATLKDLKQANGNNSLRHYITTFNRCVSVLGAEGDPRIKYDFVRGLTARYREKCLLMDYLKGDRTLQELQRMLEQYEVTMHETATYYPSYQRNAGGQYNRNDPMELGATHLEQQDGGYRRRDNGGRRSYGPRAPRPLPQGVDQATFEERRRNGLCFVCGAHDHRSYDCPKAKTPEEQGNETGAQN